MCVLFHKIKNIEDQVGRKWLLWVGLLPFIHPCGSDGNLAFQAVDDSAASSRSYQWKGNDIEAVINFSAQLHVSFDSPNTSLSSGNPAVKLSLTWYDSACRKFLDMGISFRKYSTQDEYFWIRERGSDTGVLLLH